MAQSSAPDTVAREMTASATPPNRHAPKSRLSQVAVLVGFGILGILVVMAITLWNVFDTLTSIEAQNMDLSAEVADLGDRVASAEEAAQEAEAAAVALAAVAQSSPQVANPSTALDAPLPDNSATSLPPLPQAGTDPAIGLVLDTFEGTEYYTASNVAFDPADGTARAIFIWAHWCPYCQEEMPIVQDLYSEVAATFEHLEIVSVTTSIDPSRSNPLEPYLDEGEYDFPVLVDPDGALAAHFGVTAFPFWVFTAPDGTVLARRAGLLPEEQLVSIFEQLETLGAEA